MGIPRAGIEVGMLSLVAALALVPVGVRGQNVVWDDGNGDGLWVTPSNWDGDAVPVSDSKVFLPAPTPGTGMITLPAGAVGAELDVDGLYTLSGGDLTIANRVWVAPTSGGTLGLTGGTTFATPSLTIGVANSSSGGAVSVSGGATLSVSGNLGIGYAGTSHSLNLDSAATAGSVTVGGETIGTTANYFFVNSGASLTTGGTMTLGYRDSGNAGIVVGSLSTGLMQIGTFAGSNSNGLALSTGATWSGADTAIVGLGGSSNSVTNAGGTMTMGVGGKDFVVGHNAGANANITTIKQSGTLSINGGLYAGKGGSNNQVFIGDGTVPGSTGTVTSTLGRIGAEAGSNGNRVTVANAGSKWTMNNALRVGGAGDDNELIIEKGGVVEVTGNKNVWVGYSGTANGNRIEVKGAGSLLDVQGTGELTITNSTPASGDNNAVFVSSGGHINTAKVNLGPGSVLAFGGSSGIAGTVSSTAPIIGYGAGDMFTPGSTPSIVMMAHNDAAFTLANSIQGTANVLAQGTGTTILTGANTYTGATIIGDGTLRLSGLSNNIASSASILVVPGAVFDVSTVSGGFSLGSGQVLEGDGTVIGNVDAPAGSTVRGGTDLIAGAGVLTFTDNLTMQGGSNLNVALLSDNPVAADQTNAGTLWSMVQVDGTASLTGLDIVPLTINLESGGTASATDSTWAILSATGGIDLNGTQITTFTDYTSFFDVNALAGNGMGGWTAGAMDWKVISMGDSNTLYLQGMAQAAVPEPGQTMAVLVVGGFLGGRVLRRRRTV